MKSIRTMQCMALAVLFTTTGPSLFAQEATPSDRKFEEILDAHGSLAQWQSFQSVSFDLRDWPTGAETPRLNDNHQVDLKGRKHFVDGEGYQVGWDGSVAWVTPSIEKIATLPRFYLSGSQYFAGMPFVFVDPGASIQYHSTTGFDGKEYDKFTVSYEQEVGDAGNSFVLYTDAQTHLLRLIHFDVDYPAIKGILPRQSAFFDEWQDVGNLVIPKAVTFRKWEGDKQELGPGATFRFVNVVFSKDPLDSALFVKPENAVIDNSHLPN